MDTEEIFNFFQNEFIPQFQMHGFCRKYGIKSIKASRKYGGSAQIAFNREMDEFPEELVDFVEDIETDSGLPLVAIPAPRFAYAFYIKVDAEVYRELNESRRFEENYDDYELACMQAQSVVRSMRKKFDLETIKMAFKDTLAESREVNRRSLR